jgi:hypothetical protein
MPLSPPRQSLVPSRTALYDRLRAAGLHLALSAALAVAVVAFVLLGWYPPPMAGLLGVDAILLIMLGVDVVLGPLFTLLVFDRRKKRLGWDLATIAALQLLALGYGLHTLHEGRPAFVVLVKDRFEVVSPAELRAEDRAQARGNRFARPDPLRPRWVAARMPDSAQERSAIQQEVNQLQNEIGRTVETTAFNGKKLLDGSLQNARFQVGPADGQEISLSISGAQTPNVDLTSFDGASSAITTLDASLRSVNDQRATLGATMNRLQSTLGNIDTNVDAVLASRSRIQDADVASESAERARQEVLARGTIAILAQANIIPGVANRLLGA